MAESRDSLNRKWLTLPLGFFLFFATVGLWLDDFDRQSWSALCIEVASAVGLVSVVMLVERRIVGVSVKAARGEAADAADRATSGLKERIVGLETLAEEEQQAVQKNRAEFDQALEEFQREKVAESLVELLVRANKGGLIDKGNFRVRTSDNSRCHQLYFLVQRYRNENETGRRIYLDFLPFEWDAPSNSDVSSVQEPRRRRTTVMWGDGESAGDIGAKLAAGLDRANKPSREFSIGYAFKQLVTAIEVMRTARHAVDYSEKRLEGRLQVLVNSDWAVTTSGLEAINESILFPARATGWASQLRRLKLPKMSTPNGQPETDLDLGLQEAIEWVEANTDLQVESTG